MLHGGRANAINLGGEIVGYSGSGTCPGHTHAVLWEHRHILDLNAQIAQSPLLLVDADSINDSGEIAGVGLQPSGEWRAYLLIPCEGRELVAADCRKPARGTSGIPVLTQIEARQLERAAAALPRFFSWQRFAPRTGYRR